MNPFCFVVRYEKRDRCRQGDAKEHHEQLVVEARDLLEAYRIAKLTCESRGYSRFQIFKVPETQCSATS